MYILNMTDFSNFNNGDQTILGRYMLFFKTLAYILLHVLSQRKNITAKFYKYYIKHVLFLFKLLEHR